MYGWDEERQQYALRSLLEGDEGAGISEARDLHIEGGEWGIAKSGGVSVYWDSWGLHLESWVSTASGHASIAAQVTLGEIRWW